MALSSIITTTIQEPVLRECKASLVEKYATAGRLGEEVKALQNQLENKSGQVSIQPQTRPFLFPSFLLVGGE